MKHLLFAVFAGGVLGSVAARADAWDAFEHGGGPMTIVESSVVIHLPWGGPILHELSGEPAGCGSKPVGAPFLVLDTQMFGFPNSLRFDLFELDSEFPVWGRVDRLEQCIEVAGQQITLEQTSFILNGRLTELATPVAQRCGGEPADLRIDLSDAVLSPAPGASPGVLEVPYSFGCGPGRVPSGDTIALTDFSATILARGGEAPNAQEIVSLEAAETVCRPLGDDPVYSVHATVSVDAPSTQAFPFEHWYELSGSPSARTPAVVARGETQASFDVVMPAGHLGELTLIARATHPRPDGTYSSAEATVEVLPATDPACPLGRLLLDPERWEPRWDGCWNCGFSISRLMEPRIINERLVLGATTRARNGVAATNVFGMVASVSANAAGLPSSFITLGDRVLHALQGVELRDLNTLGMAVGARVDPKSQLRSAVWFDGQHVKELGTLGGASSDALALSDSGWLVGWAEDGQGLRRAFISRDGKLEQLPLPPHLESEARSIGGDRWVSGTLVTEKGRQGFLFDLESGAVHLAELPEEGASIAFHGANVWGRVAGVLTTHNQEVVPILFSAEEGRVRLDELAKLPAGFVPENVDGLSDDGSVFVSGRLNGERAHFRFSP